MAHTGVGWYRDGELISTWFVSSESADKAVADKPDYLEARIVDIDAGQYFRRSLSNHDAAYPAKAAGIPLVRAGNGFVGKRMRQAS